MHNIVQIILTANLAFIAPREPAYVDKPGMDELRALLEEVSESTLLDSCELLLDRLIDETGVFECEMIEAEYLALFERLFTIETEPGSLDEARLSDLIDRAKAAYAGYLFSLDELPADVVPSFIWDEIDTLSELRLPTDMSGALFDEQAPFIDSSGLHPDSPSKPIRAEKLPPVPLVLNRQVEQSILYFRTKGRKVMQLWLDRSAEMVPVILPVLREEGLPDELVYLAMVESGFRVHAYSWAHAAGPWQFIAPTARRYGLQVDWWFDQRRAPVLSTRAAAAYLRDLYGMFDDWFLAMAAYNCGENKVKRLVKRYGGDFWKIRRMPRQTRNYVPSYLAAYIIALNPGYYGFSLPDPVPVPQMDEVVITECVDLKALAECAGTNMKTLNRLNPALVRWCTPPNRDSVTVNLPAGAVEAGFWERYASIPAEKKVSYVRHKVSRGETLSTIAARYGVPQRIIANHPKNGIRNRHRIRAGQILVIPGVSPQRDRLVQSRYDEPTDLATDRVHIVRRGDTLSEIAARYGLSVSRLKRLNGLYGKRYIYPNQRLRLYGGGGESVSRTNRIASGASHVVMSGDSLWSISRKYGVSLSALRRENGLEGRSLIRPGQRLVIPTHK